MLQEGSLDRPVAAHINLCPKALEDDREIASLVADLKHELLHALGFSVQLYGFFRCHPYLLLLLLMFQELSR